MSRLLEITKTDIFIKDLVKDYVNNEEEGVYAYGGKLNIRPKYQREFIYKRPQQEAVIDTVLKDFPLNTIYWVDNGDGYEVLDGQQRIMSICEFYAGNLTIGYRGFDNLTEDERETFLNYPLMVYICKGTDKQRLEWFQTINIRNEKLTDQELRNAVYPGEWLTDAKKHFSKTGCPASDVGAKYTDGSHIRQKVLETVLKWISDRDGLVIEQYMAKHQNDDNAEELWNYFCDIIDWIKELFPKYRKEMKTVDWGFLYNKYKDKKYDPVELETRVKKYMEDDEIQKRAGIYAYVLGEDEKVLNLRTFSDTVKRAVYERQNGICAICGKRFELEDMHADHIVPWIKGGKTAIENCQMLCIKCNLNKSSHMV